MKLIVGGAGSHFLDELASIEEPYVTHKPYCGGYVLTYNPCFVLIFGLFLKLPIGQCLLPMTDIAVSLRIFDILRYLHKVTHFVDN